MVGNLSEERREYFEGIGMERDLVERAESVLADVERFLSEPAELVFVSERTDEDGKRSYDSIWLLTPTLLCEAMKFVDGSTFDLVRSDSGISRVVVDRDNFDFDVARESSSLAVDVNFAGSSAGIHGRFKASGANCLRLQEVLERYLIPLLLRRA